MKDINGENLSTLLDFYEKQLQDEEADRQYLLENILDTLRKAIQA